MIAHQIATTILKIVARAKPNDVTGNHPGTKWDGKSHIHIPGAGRGGHVPVEPGVRPR